MNPGILRGPKYVSLQSPSKDYSINKCYILYCHQEEDHFNDNYNYLSSNLRTWFKTYYITQSAV